MMINYEDIGKRIAKRRGILNLTQEELAAKASLSRNQVGNIERALSKFSFEAFMSICEALEVDPNYIALGTCEEDNKEDIHDAVADLRRCDAKKQKFARRFIEWLVDEDIG